MQNTFNWFASIPVTAYKWTTGVYKALDVRLQNAKKQPAARSVDLLTALLKDPVIQNEWPAKKQEIENALAAAKENLKASYGKQIDFALALEPPEGLRRLKNLQASAPQIGQLDQGLAQRISNGIIKLTSDAENYIRGMIAPIADQVRLAQENAVRIKEPNQDRPGAAIAAKALILLINTAPETIKQAKMYAERAGLTQQFAAEFNNLPDVRATLQDEYKRLMPKRTTTDQPTKANVPPGNPGLPGLKKEDAEKLDSYTNSTNAAMSKVPPETVPLDILQAQTELLDGALKQTTVQPHKELEKCGYDWVKVKEEYKRLQAAADPNADKYMQTMWWFRRKIVDATMAALQKQYGFKWVSVGSSNLESDYDITVMSHGTVDGKPGSKAFYDFQIVQEFNKRIASEFGNHQPGTIFDTNLYATAEVEGKIETPAMKAMAEQGQDVGALMKMRRYMDWEEFDEFQKNTLAGIEDVDKKAEMQRQFEEADDLYFTSVREQLLQAGYKAIPTSQQDVTPQVQKELLDKLAHLQENEPDKVMQANNELYVKAMEEVRDYEQQLKEAEKSLNSDNSDGNAQEEFDALLARLKTAQANAVYYAAEAYHSEGPLKHVVGADQGADAAVKSNLEAARKEYLTALAEAKKAELTKEELEKATETFDKDPANELKKVRKEKLTLNQLLQSFNENLGDLLKDIAHYNHESPFPGKGFYRASKYLERLCDSLELIQTKKKDANTLLIGTIADATFNGKSPADAKKVAVALKAYRSGKIEFKGQPPEEAEAWACDEMQTLGCTTLTDLGTMAKTCGQAVNAAVRKAIADQMKTGGAKSEQAYFNT
jgi:hypothetical protein